MYAYLISGYIRLEENVTVRQRWRGGKTFTVFATTCPRSSVVVHRLPLFAEQALHIPDKEGPQCGHKHHARVDPFCLPPRALVGKEGRKEEGTWRVSVGTVSSVAFVGKVACTMWAYWPAAT